MTRVGNRGYFMSAYSQSHCSRLPHRRRSDFRKWRCAWRAMSLLRMASTSAALPLIQQYGHIGRNAFVGGVTGVPDDVVPYGMVWGDRARLHGLNLIGLKRKGITARAHPRNACGVPCNFLWAWNTCRACRKRLLNIGAVFLKFSKSFALFMPKQEATDLHAATPRHAWPGAPEDS